MAALSSADGLKKLNMVQAIIAQDAA